MMNQKYSTKKEILMNVIGIVLTAIFLFPLYWMVVTSLKSPTEIFATPPTLWPKEISIAGYVSQFFGGQGDSYGVPTYFLNSVILSLGTTIISLILGNTAAYGLARFHIFGKKAIILFILITQMLPNSLLLTPMFIIFKKFGILNTYMAVIIADATMTVPFSILTLRPYYLGTIIELEEAARIDGCGRFGVFMRIVIPTSYPGIIVAAAFSFLMSWGNLMYPLTFISDGSKWPMTIEMYKAIGQYGTRWDSLMAFATIVVLPVMIIFIFLQRYMIAGLTSGSVKE